VAYFPGYGFFLERGVSCRSGPPVAGAHVPICAKLNSTISSVRRCSFSSPSRWRACHIPSFDGHFDDEVGFRSILGSLCRRNCRNIFLAFSWPEP